MVVDKESKAVIACKNIYEKMSAITNELSNVAKNLEVGYGQSKYNAVGEADILKAVKPLEAKYKVYSYPFSRTIVESGTIENAKGTKQLFERIEVIYRFVNIECPTDFIDITSYGDGLDVGDKSVGKAMTYADKYALMKAYKIITGDDPDQHLSEGINNVKQTIPQATLDKAKSLNIELVDLASYLKKDVNALTNQDLLNAINQKEAYLKAHNKEGK